MHVKRVLTREVHLGQIVVRETYCAHITHLQRLTKKENLIRMDEVRTRRTQYTCLTSVFFLLFHLLIL